MNWVCLLVKVLPCLCLQLSLQHRWMKCSEDQTRTTERINTFSPTPPPSTFNYFPYCNYTPFVTRIRSISLCFRGPLLALSEVSCAMWVAWRTGGRPTSLHYFHSFPYPSTAEKSIQIDTVPVFHILKLFSYILVFASNSFFVTPSIATKFQYINSL
jgi:hypothetical protein